MVRSILFVIVLAAISAPAIFGARARSEFGQEVDVVKQPGSFCRGCRSIVSFMSRFNSSVRRDENKDLFGRFCETYYPVSTDFRLGPCPIFVEGLFNVLDRIDPVNQCDEIGACGSIDSSSQVLAEQDQGPDEPVCNFCTDVVKQAKAQIEDPRLIDDIHKKVDAFCEYLTVIDADKQCRTALESYIDQALEFIKQVKPRDLCRSLQLCGPQPPAVGIIATNSKVLPSLADFSDFGMETSVRVGDQQVKSLNEMDMNNQGIKSPNCVFCKVFVKEMFKFLRENRTEENVRNALDSGCELIYHDKDNRDHCKDLVRAYTKELIELLVDETNPEVICVLLDQCTFQTMKQTTRKPVYRLGVPMSRQRGVVANKSPVTMSQLISMLDPTIQEGSMRTCIECKLFVKYLQETLQEKSSQEDIKNWLLTNLCDNLGDENLADTCTNLINKESAVFFKAVVESLNPEKSCENLGACSAHIRSQYMAQLKQQLETMVMSESTTSQPLSGKLCDQCVEVVTKIDDYLSAHPIDHDIAVLKDKVCNTIEDSKLRGECVMIIQTFGQEIIQALSNMDSPQQLCSKIRLC